jgi:hypothetical protein
VGHKGLEGVTVTHECFKDWVGHIWYIVVDSPLQFWLQCLATHGLKLADIRAIGQLWLSLLLPEWQCRGEVPSGMDVYSVC